MITLYSMPSSGNSYKVRLLLAYLDIPYKHIEVEYAGDATLTMLPEFRAKNPTGKVPLVEFENGDHLAESNAILHYFGEGTAFIPTDKLQRARMYQWMFFEQNFHEGTVAVRRATFVYPQREMDRSPKRMAELLESGHKALDVMETQLTKSKYLAGDTMSLADISLYGYTHSAESGGFDLQSRPAILRWLKDIGDQPGHVTLEG